MENLKSNSSSHLTGNEIDALSLPAKILLNRNLLIGDVLDFGCGFGKDVELLNEQGVNIIGYDKQQLPTYPQKKFDTIICFYLLNALPPEEQSAVLMKLSQLIKPTGKVYISVRRDTQVVDNRMDNIQQKNTVHYNVVLNSKSFFKNEYLEIYEYQHYNQLKRNQDVDCIFCNPEADRELIVESETAYAVFDKFPVSKGHALIIPKGHLASYFDLPFNEQSACWFMMNKVKEILTKQFKPDGFNVGINIEESAGQTIPHVHIHLIPRYKNDVENPRGGVRGVIPHKRNY